MNDHLRISKNPIIYKDWKEYFPLDNPRPGQIEVINSALNAFLVDGKDTFLCDLPTGTGKSAIGVTIARYFSSQNRSFESENSYSNGAYFLTTQKVLQQQYLRDFEDERRGGMLELKSATNYTCGYDVRQSCGESKRALTALGKAVDGTEWKKHCTQACTYNAAKRAFIQGHLGITNYSYFMAETTYAGKLEPRALLVADECHNIETEVCKFVEVEITERFCKKNLGISIAKSNDPDKLFKWMKETYKPALAQMFDQVKQSLQMFADGQGMGGEDIFRNLIKQNDLFDKHICKVNRFIERFDPNMWIINRESRRDHRGEKLSLQFKPIDASTWAEPYLFRFGEKRLLMSATILDKQSFCMSLGLDQTKTEYMGLPSTFPACNRPIHYMPVGKLSMREMDATLPKLTQAVKTLLEAHHTEKGIIHVSNFRVAHHLRDSLQDPRILVHGSENRDDILRLHHDSLEPTVLVSPSMTEGVDLSDDLARFTIIAKLPYPNLGDKSLKKRCDRDPWYYDYLTVRSFVQALGRGVRHEKDECITYILDGCFEMFLRKNKRLIPQYILDAMT
jgi:Rad3-related DNA helicase